MAWSDRCSYLDDVLFLLLEGIEEALRTGNPVAARFDAEGWEYLIVFDLNASEIYQRIAKDGGKPKTARTPVFPAGWKDQFGLPYREHQKSLQINIFDGYAIYGIKDSSVSSTASVENVTSVHTAYQPEVPVQEGSVNG